VPIPLPDLKPIVVNEKLQALIDLLLAGKAVGSGRSIGGRPTWAPMGPGNVPHVTKEDIEKSVAAAFRTSDDNYFKDPTVDASRTYAKTCTDSVRDCTVAVTQGMPVWFGPIATSDPEESTFMKGLLERTKACARNASKQCLLDNKPYAYDLDDYGPPRMQRALGKLLAFLRDMRREAHVYQTTSAEEEGIRKTFVENPYMEVLKVRLYSENKKKWNWCGTTGAYACSGGVSGMEGIYLPVFEDPEKNLHVFIHEVGHAFRDIANASRSRAIPSSTCKGDEAHDDFWHRCCVFLSHMAMRVLARRGVIKTKGEYKQIMRPNQVYHGCFVGRGMPLLDEPGTW
jgi:hypothetical protein